MDRLTATGADAGSRLDVFVARGAGVSRARAGALIDGGHVTVNGVARRKSHTVADGEIVEVGTPEAVEVEAPSGVEVRYEDEHLLVAYKPSGVVVHAAPGLREGTLVDALGSGGRALAAGAGEGRAGIVHRLDRDVSGLLVVAKTDEAHAALVAAMKAREIDRRYLALVAGEPATDRGKIDAPIGRDPRHRTRMAVLADGRPAVTWFRVSERLRGPGGAAAALLDVKLETGRTHQIRTHLASIGLPIVGDAAYGRDPALARSLGLRRPFLHAYRLAFAHPVSGEEVVVEESLPGELASVLEAMRPT